MQIGNITNLQWLWIIGVAALAVMLGTILRRRALTRFADAALLARLLPPKSPGRRFVKSILLTVAMLFIVAALVDPRWGRRWRKVPEQSVNVMFVLDVSRSMLAEDASPSRLERAKLQIADMLQAMDGARAGLIVFAGSARQIVPLTLNPREVTTALSQAGPNSVDRGGSSLIPALQLAEDCLKNVPGSRRLVVVWTDGEDPETATPTAENAFHPSGDVDLCIVGLGDSDAGARIPLGDGSRKSYLQHEGQDVVSRMNAPVLREIAEAAGGLFVPAGTKHVDMAQVSARFAADHQTEHDRTSRVREFVPRYQWFLAAALVLIVLETFIGERATRSREVLA